MFRTVVVAATAVPVVRLASILLLLLDLKRVRLKQRKLLLQLGDVVVLQLTGGERGACYKSEPILPEYSAGSRSFCIARVPAGSTRPEGHSSARAARLNLLHTGG